MDFRAARRGIVLLLAGACLTSPAWALFDLSASPRKGGRDLRFETGLSTTVSREEELTLTAESDRSVPYRIYVTMLSPLTNEQGRVMKQDALYVFSPSQTLGDLRLKLESPLPLGQTVVYTSNSSGDSDQMVLVFHLNLPESIPGGSYRAALSFTLEPMVPTADLSPRTVTLNVVVEIKPTFHFSVKTQRGGSVLDLGRLGKEGAPAGVTALLHAENNTGHSFRIFQELRGPLRSDTGLPLASENIRFEAGVEGAGRTGAAQSLSETPVLLFDSSTTSGPADLSVTYQVNPEGNLAAGRYEGSIFYRIESASILAAGQSAELPLRFEVEPIFNLDIQIPDGLGLQFGNLKSGQSGIEKKIILNVQSNLGAPYQVSQFVARRMSTPDGAALPESAFQFFVERTKTGSVSSVAARPVQIGDSMVFISDASGTPETLLCTYTLDIPLAAKAGSYGTDIKYTITTL